jgi:hypothetical protein
MAQELSIIDLRHPQYTLNELDWELWRLCYAGGSEFIERYLKRFSKREDDGEFKDRKDLTCCPSFSAEAIDEIKNSIYQRMVDITREGASDSYDRAVDGLDHGVDLIGSSMNYFIGQKILPELLTMRKVGVYVDMPDVRTATLMEARQSKARPYLYYYRAEEILNWMLDDSSEPNEYSSVLLMETYEVRHPKFAFPYKTEVRFRHMFLDEEGYCNIAFYNTASEMIDERGLRTEQLRRLNIKRIPFVMFELPYSLLKDVARYQVALLNLTSSDINFVFRANFPLYTEQQDWRSNSQFTKGEGSADDNSNTTGPTTTEIQVGAASGRAYGQGLDRPGFIHPSPEPLKASLMKQDQMKQEIRQLVNLSVSNLAPLKQQSVASKQMDNQGLESGLSFIGLELERGERRIADFWAMYEKGKSATVYYPQRYSLKSEAEKRAEADQCALMLPLVPSITLQKALAKLIARALVGYKVSRKEMDKIESEIDQAKFIAGDPAILQKSVELGILDRANAAKIMLYPHDAIDNANAEHADRLTRIQDSQAPKNGASRGVADTSGDPFREPNLEKTASRATDVRGDNVTRTRGDGQ